LYKKSKKAFIAESRSRYAKITDKKIRKKVKKRSAGSSGPSWKAKNKKKFIFCSKY
jgi:hypothetical protein